jgi:beta-lactamase class A
VSPPQDKGQERGVTPIEPGLQDLFEGAGVTGWLHARDLQTGREVAHGADHPVVLASLFNIPVLLELFVQRAEAGELDAAAPVTVPVEGRAPGPCGLSGMRDAAQLSLRDLAWLMMGVSDNAATDLICEVVGIDKVNERLASLGLHQSVLIGDCRDIFAKMAQDAQAPGAETLEEVDWSSHEVLDRLRALDPRATTSSTARQITELRAMIWATRRPPSRGLCRGAPDPQPSGVAAPARPPDSRRTTCGSAARLGRSHGCATSAASSSTRTAGATSWRSSRGASVSSSKNPSADAVIGAAGRRAVDLLAPASAGTERPTFRS